MKHLRLLPVPLALLALARPALAEPTFAETATKYFSTWDFDHDGVLSAKEVDVLCVEPIIKGPEAAAAATLKQVLRNSSMFDARAFSLQYLLAPAPKAPRRTDGKAPPPQPMPGDAGRIPVNFQSLYAANLKRITTSRRALFLDDTPDLDKGQQGLLGDCFFVACVGALVHRDPQDVKGLITARPQGGYEVQFRNGTRATLGALTDAEVALSGSTGDEGLWLPVLEKAAGQAKQEVDPKQFKTQSATDAIAGGGSIKAAIAMLTGHKSTRVSLTKQYPSEDEVLKGKPRATLQDGDTPENLAVKVRASLAAGFADRRLIIGDTAYETRPPGLAPIHAYAIFAYDDKADTITVWNPWGQTFRPKGKPGRENGYPITRGLFTIPVTDFVIVFNGVTIEGDEAVDAKPPAPAPKPPAPSPKR